MKQRVMPSLSDLLDRLTQLEDRTSKAEERAARAEARAAQLENATGNLAAAVVDPRPMSRRSLLTKVAAAGAVGVAGSLILAKPKDVFASFAWTGGTSMAADHETIVTAAAAFPDPAVIQFDANQGANPNNNADGIRSFASGFFSGIAAYGGNKGGAGGYLGGGNGTAGVNAAGSGLITFSGQNFAGGSTGNYAAEIFGNGASDGLAGGNALVAQAGGTGGYNWLIGSAGTGTTATNHVGGGVGLYCYGGPNNTALIAIGGGVANNPALPAHGVQGAGNVLGVGGYFQGGRAQIQMIPNGAVGAPTSGVHFPGDLFMDAKEVIWVCTVSGAPGTFAPLQPGGMNNALFTAVSTQQYTFVGSDGVTWADMDPTNLKLTITPTYNCQAILTASTDLWTAAAGLNQDIGISVSGGAYPTTAGQPEGWKESGGFAGTFSPNAAHVDTIVPLAAGTAYTAKIVWKTNKPSGGKLIAAGAGPINAKFSPTRLTAWLVPTNPGGTIPLTPAKPYVHEVPQLRAPSADPYGRKQA